LLSEGVRREPGLQRLIADGLGVTRIAFHSGYAILAGLGFLVLALIVTQSLQLPSLVLNPPPKTSILPTSATQKASSGQTLVGQASVIDGDTIDIHGTRIRFSGIDAPESAQTCEVEGASYRCGQKAALALGDFIGNHTVSCNKTGIDRYRRVIAKCFADGVDLSSWMVLNGWAIAYRKYSMDYVADEDRARNQKIGIWAGTFVAPELWRKGKQKGE
jgi:endonuclease YncB( thermonuclease family)